MEALVVLAFVVVILVVPVLLAPPPSDRDAEPPVLDHGGTAPSSFFGSRRERRLWMWTLIVLVGIFSSLGPARDLASALRERNLLGVSSAAVVLLVFALIAVRWAKKRPGRREVGVTLGVAAVYLTALARIPIPEERTHLFEYGVVAILIHLALTERRRQGRRLPAPAVLAVVATALLGWLDEGIQALIPDRVYDLRDVGFNALAGLMAIAAILLIGWARSWDVFNRRSE